MRDCTSCLTASLAALSLTKLAAAATTKQIPQTTRLQMTRSATAVRVEEGADGTGGLASAKKILALGSIVAVPQVATVAMAKAPSTSLHGKTFADLFHGVA